MMPDKRATEEGRVRKGTSATTERVLPTDRLTAARLGRYCISLIASRTARRVDSRTCLLPFRTRDTVPVPTPTRAATSAMFTDRGFADGCTDLSPPPHGTDPQWNGFHAGVCMNGTSGVN